MMEILLFTLNAIVIYLLADWIIRTIEKKKGEVLNLSLIIIPIQDNTHQCFLVL